MESPRKPQKPTCVCVCVWKYSAVILFVIINIFISN